MDYVTTKNVRVEVLDSKPKIGTRNKYPNTYAGALFMESLFGAVNFRRGPTISALPTPAPFYPCAAPTPLELFAGAVFCAE